MSRSVVFHWLQLVIVPVSGVIVVGFNNGSGFSFSL